MDKIVNKILKLVTEAKKNIDPKLKVWISDRYGPWDERDFISDDGDKDNNYKSILNIIEDFHVEKSFSKNYISLPIFLLEIIFKFFIHHSPPNRIYSQEKIMKLGFHSKLSISEATIQILTSLKKL